MLNDKLCSLKRVLLISLIILILISIGAFYYLKCERTVKIYDQYEVHSERETWGKGWGIVTSEKRRQAIMKDFGIRGPAIDFDKHYLLWSDGRKIKAIKYRIITKFQWHHDVPMGVEVFGEKHYPHKMFLYKINKVLVKQNLD